MSFNENEKYENPVHKKQYFVSENLLLSMF